MSCIEKIVIHKKSRIYCFWGKGNRGYVIQPGFLRFPLRIFLSRLAKGMLDYACD